MSPNPFRPFWPIVILLVALPATGTAAEPAECPGVDEADGLETHHAQGRQWADREQWERARNCLERANWLLRRDRDHSPVDELAAEIRNDLSVALYELGDYERAHDIALLAMRPPVLSVVARAYFNAGRALEAHARDLAPDEQIPFLEHAGLYYARSLKWRPHSSVADRHQRLQQRDDLSVPDVEEPNRNEFAGTCDRLKPDFHPVESIDELCESVDIPSYHTEEDDEWTTNCTTRWTSGIPGDDSIRLYLIEASAQLDQACHVGAGTNERIFLVVERDATLMASRLFDGRSNVCPGRHLYTDRVEIEEPRIDDTGEAPQFTARFEHHETDHFTRGHWRVERRRLSMYCQIDPDDEPGCVLLPDRYSRQNTHDPTFAPRELGPDESLHGLYYFDHSTLQKPTGGMPKVITSAGALTTEHRLDSERTSVNLTDVSGPSVPECFPDPSTELELTE